jgi:hypothetical protein
MAALSLTFALQRNVMVQRARKTCLSSDLARVSAHSGNCVHEARTTELAAREYLDNLHAQFFGP